MNKPTRTPKQDALAAISALPDGVSFEEIARVLDGHRLRSLLLDGLASGPGAVADEAFFAALRDEARNTRGA